MKRRTRSRFGVRSVSIRSQWGRPPVNSTLADRAAPSRAARRRRGGASGSAAELLTQQFVELRGVGLAAGRLHHLAHEKAEELVLACAKFAELAGILRHHFIDCALDGRA